MSDQPPITKAKTEHTLYVNHKATHTWSVPLMVDSGHRRSTGQVTVDSHNGTQQFTALEGKECPVLRIN